MKEGSWFCRHRFANDVGLAAFFVLLDVFVTLIGGSWWPAHPGPLAWTLLGLQVVACGSLVIRQRFPLLVMGILAAFTLLVTFLISPGGMLTPAHPQLVWAPYATALAAYGPVYAWRDKRRAFLALAVFTLVIARPWQPSAEVITIGVVRTAAGPILALYLDARRRLVQALTERAERAERERHLLAEQARTEERARLAGEMHDVVTHRVSLMVLQAGALRMTAADEATRRAAEELRAAGCQALDELRDLVGILRTAPEDDSEPGAQSLDELVAASCAAGIPARLVVTGDPALASPVVARTAYRVVREALTNVSKHAPGADQVEVRVSYEEARVQVAVVNSRPAAANGGPLYSPALAGSGSGLGLAGLRQRIELVHGTLRAGPAPDGGFGVEATLPAYVPTAQPVA